ncbi:hypothetical protein AURDEDRAFT_115694 [Auricularia subglabra TFB-10046 SS5]|uniref:DUF4484 domain-containing protein n=1 Tax=Auricularia subglabra (strain TFB-10046 / SS5) TaxID=717982 RepID=J0DCS6_AURST|nr:hypothetical protein AURDEDRAFT_115694 [Auricularia subglabra TFB-10046 SS5]
MAASSAWRIPCDVVAVFHASFHPTQGYIISWSQKVPEASLNLDGIEFTALPSGLHAVDSDVIYLSRDGYRGVCVFTRRKSDEEGARGFRLESLGLMVANSPRSFPWRHLPALKEIAREVAERGEGWDWAPLQAWYETRKLRPEVGLSTETLTWEEELTRYPASHPALHLPHLLRILGPSSLTLYKHVLARRRVLIYAQPPVEPACILAYIASDVCFGSRNRDSTSRGHAYLSQSPGVLGMVTLNDLETLQSESWAGTGWIACTTDAIFMEKPYLYDLLIDMSTANWVTQSRPTMYLSRYNPAAAGTKKPTHRLSPVRFTWSDVRLWNELDRVLRTDPPAADGAPVSDPLEAPPPGSSAARAPAQQPTPLPPPLLRTDSASTAMSTSWTDPWKIYEDACVVCASIWLSGLRTAMGGGNLLTNWREGGSGGVHLEGEDAALQYGVNVRKVGQGIEGKRIDSKPRRVSLSNTPNRVASPVPGIPPLPVPIAGTSSMTETAAKHQHQVQMTLILLNVFHTHTEFLLDRLGELLGIESGAAPVGAGIAYNPDNIVLTARDVMALELGPLSDLDARFVQWLAEKTELAGGRKVVVRRSWRDLLAAVFGF